MRSIAVAVKVGNSKFWQIYTDCSLRMETGKCRKGLQNNCVQYGNMINWSCSAEKKSARPWRNAIKNSRLCFSWKRSKLHAISNLSFKANDFRRTKQFSLLAAQNCDPISPKKSRRMWIRFGLTTWTHPASSSSFTSISLESRHKLVYKDLLKLASRYQLKTEEFVSSCHTGTLKPILKAAARIRILKALPPFWMRLVLRRSRL